MQSDGALAAAGFVSFVLEAIDGVSQIGDVVVVRKSAGAVEVGVNAGAGLVVFSFFALDAMIFGVCPEDAAIILVLVAVRRWAILFQAPSVTNVG